MSETATEQEWLVDHCVCGHHITAHAKGKEACRYHPGDCAAYRWDEVGIRRVPAAVRADTDNSRECQQSDWCGPGSHCLCVPAIRPAKPTGEPTVAETDYRPGLRGYIHFLRHGVIPLRQRLRPSARLRKANEEITFWQWCAETPVVERGSR